MRRNSNCTKYCVQVFLFFFGMAFGLSAQATIAPAERAALIALYNSTNGPTWTTNNDWDITDASIGLECSWSGVTCVEDPSASGTYYVTGLGLSTSGLNGTIPVQLSDLTRLQNLSLAENQLHGSIPVQLGSLVDLVTLSLHVNQLSGAIPAELGNLNNLTDLYLHFNQLDGAIPDELGYMAKIRILQLNANKLSSVIPGNLINATDTLLGVDVRYNAVHSIDTSLLSALSSRHIAGTDLTLSQTIDPAGLAITQTGVSTVDLSWDPVTYTSSPVSPFPDHDGGYRIYLSSTTPDKFTQHADIAGKASTSTTLTSLTNCISYRAKVHSYTLAHIDEPVPVWPPINENNPNEVESNGELSNVVEFTTHGCAELPVITLPIPTPSISESAIIGTYVATLAATDADADPLYFTITGGNTGNAFAIQNSGEIKVASGLDYETTTDYILSIEVSDGVNVTPANVTINIINENDRTPIPVVGTISHPTEDAAIDSAIVTISATDPDGSSSFSYRITTGNTDNDFAISAGGVITIANALDYERTQIYTLMVEVSDSINVTPVEVVVNVGNLNDNFPIPFIASITPPLESAAIGTVVATISATDTDGSTTFIYSMTGTAFAIDPASGIITIAATLDFESNPTYNETVTVSDGVNSSPIDIMVNISNANDSSPILVGGSITHPLETAEIGTMVANIAATDPDDGSTTFTYSILSGNDAGAFAISDAGAITVASALDYETTNSYTLAVEVSDGANTASINFTINIIDVDESTGVAAAGGGGGGGCSVRAGAEFDPTLLFWICLSALYLMRKRPVTIKKLAI